ncbi:MAG: hypothetical protein NWP47_05235 [Rickettsiaceae bacterium]|nr:hypothetical protein [Rickettsiaceae bacterium]
MAKNNNKDSKHQDEKKTEVQTQPSMWDRVTGGANYIKGGLDYVMNTTPVKYATSSAVGRTIGVATTIATVTAATIPAAAIGITSVVVGAGIDTAQTRNMRFLRKENKLLIKNRYALESQAEMLKNNPRIASALSDELYKPNREGKLSTTERLAPNPKEHGFNLTGFGKAIFTKSLEIGKRSVETVFNPSIMNVGKLANDAKGLVGEGLKQGRREDKMRQLKVQIDAEREKTDTLGYDNIDELAENVRTQRIQTLAIKKILLDKNINLENMSSDQIREKFNEAKIEVETTEKAIQSELTPMSYVRDFVRAHQPTGKYRDMDKIEINTKESIANDTSIPTKENIKNARLKISESKQLAAEARKIGSKSRIRNRTRQKVGTKNPHRKLNKSSRAI